MKTSLFAFNRSPSRASLPWVIATAVLFGAMISSSALAARNISLNSGTVIPVTLDSTLSSKDSRQGETFTATVRTGDQQAYAGLPEGTRVVGVIKGAKAHSGKNPGVLDLAFRKIQLPDGTSTAITGSLIGLDNKSVTQAANGRYVAKGSSKTNRLTYVGYGAGAGLLVSVLTDSKHSVRNTLIGGGLGYLYASTLKGKGTPSDVTLKSGTELGVRLDKTARVNLQYAGYEDSTTSGSTSRLAVYNDGSSGSSYGGVGVVVDGRKVAFDSPSVPLIKNGVLLVPAAVALRAANVPFEMMADNTVISTSGDPGPVTLAIGSRTALVNETARVALEAPAEMIGDSLYVPMRFVGLASGRLVKWDPQSRTASLSDNADTRSSEGQVMDF